MNIEEEIKEINFRMGLLRENTELSLFLYDSEVKKQQWEDIKKYYRELDTRIYNGEDVHSSTYEHEILSLVNRKKLDYHFAESVAELYWKDSQYKEIFESLYKDSIKFKHLFK